MAQDKKGFILYADLIHTVEKMPKDKAGELLLTILRYVNDKDPVVDDIVVDLVFEPIKQQLKRDLKKYEVRAERSRNNGKLGGRPKNLEEPRKPSGLKNNLTEPRKPDTVNVTDTDKGKDILKRKQDFRLSISHFIKANPNKYPKQLFVDFEEYWTEHGAKDKKMRFEKQKTFGLSRRLSSWSKTGFNDYTTPNNPSINNQPVN
jgi:hypothetical protein